MLNDLVIAAVQTVWLYLDIINTKSNLIRLNDRTESITGDSIFVKSALTS